MNELSDTKIRNAKPADKEYTLADGQGFSVRVQVNGTKIWLYRYRFGGKRKNMSFGVFPAVTLKMAREKRHDAEKLLDQRQDPAVVREAKRQEEQKTKHTFRAVGQEWLTTKFEKENKAKATIKREDGISASSIVRSATTPCARSSLPSCLPRCGPSRPAADTAQSVGCARPPPASSNSASVPHTAPATRPAT
jgi:hypothetical protein